MSAKYRNLRMELDRLGCEARQGKGSHVIYTHPSQPARQVTLCGNDGQEAPKYQVARVRKFVRGMMVYQ